MIRISWQSERPAALLSLDNTEGKSINELLDPCKHRGQAYSRCESRDFSNDVNLLVEGLMSSKITQKTIVRQVRRVETKANLAIALVSVVNDQSISIVVFLQFKN